MLTLRKATVREAGEGSRSEQEVVVELADGSCRPAIVDSRLLGRCQVGDEVIVNVQALDLGLGSGGFDVVHVNLTRGLSGDGSVGARVMKLNYSSLQHAVRVVEEAEEGLELPLRRPVAVLALHGQLAAVAWAFSHGHPGAKLGFVQTPGGALAGGRSRTVSMLRERSLLVGHITAGQSYGGEHEAITTAGAIHHGVRTLDWDAVVCGPGPGIVGSASALGHGGMQALDSAHAALALGAPTLLVARMSSADLRTRHRGVSHHTATVLDLLLEPVTVALPAGIRSSANIARHDWRRVPVDLAGYAASGLPAQTMGRRLVEDPLFFAAALAGGAALAELCELGDSLEPALVGRKPRADARAATDTGGR